MTKQPWIANYPNGVSPQLASTDIAHLPDLIRRASNKYSKSIAFTQCMPNGMNGSLTFQQIDELSDDFAVYLREVLRLSAGERVAVQMPNCLSYPIVAFGILKAGCILVNTNPLYTATEMIHQFSDAQAKVLVIIDMFADRLPEVLPKTNIETVVTVKASEYFPTVAGALIRVVQKVVHKSLPKITVKHTKLKEALSQGHKHDKRSQVLDYAKEIKFDSIAALQYTGGTTGVSKGAMLSHKNLVVNTLQMMQMVDKFLLAGKETILTALPLYHIFAFTVNLLGLYHMGGRNIVIPNPRPPSNMKKAFENYKITWVSGVNTLYNALLKEPWFLENPPKHLSASVAGGMSLHQSVATDWQKVTNSPLVEGFGLTESSPVLTFNPLGGIAKPGSIGIPMPSTDIRIVDENGKEVNVGESGELIAQGPQIMLGYWNNEKETANTIRNGWLYTGDVAQMDEDGYFKIVDRKKDVILVSGFNVYPNEIEETIAKLSNVKEVGVIGLPDENTGERVCAYIVASTGTLTQEEVIAHCEKSLARYKLPKSVVIVTELPKSPIGKILRRELRRVEMIELANKNQYRA
ncbi:MAG: AMP-binding protein [Candidatus Nanopelagicales bacterium]